MNFFRRSQGGNQPVGTSNPDEDPVLLQAEPISRARMDLLWLDPPHLAQVVKALGDDTVITVTMGDDSQMRDDDITREDIAWAKQIEKVVDIAFSAGERGDYLQSIEHYKKALALAPGCDLFLMSIGVGYSHLGQKAKGLRYLERAAGISPGNSRIRDNLTQVRRM
jgi:tetratricopeptide (TPR) repeat protein